jgi:hypothetical protein
MGILFNKFRWRGFAFVPNISFRGRDVLFMTIPGGPMM